MHSSQLRPLIGRRKGWGTVFIGRAGEGSFHVLWKGEALGRYASVEEAIQAASGESMVGPSGRIHFGEPTVGGDISDWRPATDFGFVRRPN